MTKLAATAVVLAGGRSRRMGQDKALLPFQGKPMIQHAVDALRPAFDELLVSANDPERYAFLGVPTVVDRVPDEGPLMALASVFDVARNDAVAIIACDNLSPDIILLEELLALSEGHDGAHPICGERAQPLVAVYRKARVAPQVEVLLAAGKRAMFALIEQGDFRSLPVDDTRIANINTPADYAALMDQS